MLEHFKQLNKFKYFLPIWFGINTILGILVALFLSLSVNYTFPQLIVISQISIHLISSIVSATGYYLGYKFKDFHIIVFIIVVNVGTLIVSTMISIIIYLIFTQIIGLIFYKTLNENIMKLFIPVFISTIIITIIASTMERLRRSSLKLKEELDDLKSQDELSLKGITLQEKGSHQFIKYNDIIYLSSHGKKTIVHTEDHDYEISQLIKDIEEMLPIDFFLRVHKQFIINLNFIEKIQYYTGGRYLAFLKDEEKNTIPVGRTYVANVKDKLNIS